MEGNNYDKSQQPVDSNSVITEIYQSYMKQIIGAIEQKQFNLTTQEVQANAQSKYNLYIMMNLETLKTEEKENNSLIRLQECIDPQCDQEDQDLKHSSFMKASKKEMKYTFQLVSLKDALLYHEQFMKKHYLTFSKIRRLQKEATNLNLMCSFKLNELPSKEEQNEEERQIREQLSWFYQAEKAQIQKYYPDEYLDIFAFSTATEEVVIKQRKNKDIS